VLTLPGSVEVRAFAAESANGWTQAKQHTQICDDASASPHPGVQQQEIHVAAVDLDLVGPGSTADDAERRAFHDVGSHSELGAGYGMLEHRHRHAD